PIAPAKSAEYFPGVPGRPGGRSGPGDFPGISGQHGEVSRRHRVAHRPSLFGSGSITAGPERPPRQTFAAGSRNRASSRVGAARGTVVVRAAEVADIGGVSRAPDVVAAVSG